MRAAADAGTVLLAAVLVAGCGAQRSAPATVPPTSHAAAWDAVALPESERIAGTLDGNGAVELRLTGRLWVGAEGPLAIELTLHRSGAMRLASTGDESELLVISDGALLRTRRGPEWTSEPAWREPAVEAGQPDRALSPFDLVEALLPAPWPEPAGGGLLVASVPDGTWLTLPAEAADGLTPVRRRALLAPGGDRVVLRERYDRDGALELAVEWVVADTILEIRRPRTGTSVRLEIAAMELDPAVPAGTYRPER